MTVVKARLNNQWVEVSSGNQWDTAWGILATGTIFMANPLQLDGTFRKVTNPIAITTLVGRRYRIVFQSRAIITATGGGPDSSVNFGLYDNGAARIDLADWYAPTSGQSGTAYSSTEWGTIIEGDGAAHSFEIWGRAWGTNGTAHVSSNCRYYIEDKGPTSSIATQSLTTSWTNVTFSGGWYQYPDSTFAPVQYRKIGDIVFLRGLTAGGTPTLPIFTLPPGFRSPYTLHLPIASNAAATYCHVRNNGEVTPSGGSTAWVDLGSIQFSTTP